jgi:exopolysaccharide biosynthesis polyprenyl glycosylphosphotransferase
MGDDSFVGRVYVICVMALFWRLCILAWSQRTAARPEGHCAKSDPVLTPRFLARPVELARRPPASATAYPCYERASVAQAWGTMAVEPMHDRTADVPGGALTGAVDGQPNGYRVLGRASGALRRYRAISVCLAVSDAACILMALIVVYQVRYSTRPMLARELAVVLVAPLLWVAAFRAFNLYAPQHLSPSDEFRGIIGASSLGIVLVVMASYWSKSAFPRAWLGLSWLLALLLELSTRRVWEVYRLRLKRDGRLAFRTLIVGTTGEASRLAETLKDPASGFAPIGYVGAFDPSVPANGLAVVGDIRDLRRLVHEHDADCLFVASTSVSAEDILQVTQVARQECTEVRVSANLSQTLTSRLTLQKVGGAIALSIRPVRLTRTQVAIKRTFDVVLALAALAVTLPLWAVIAIAIRLSSPGPVFFHQERVTRGGRVFRMHKFRTMRLDIDSPVDTSAPFFKLQSDPRLTRVGGLFRRLSLDELPQFWNILRGEMSLVGPRPLPADQVAANLELLSPRHEVPAGVTGWWQINGRSGVTPEEAVHLDQFYIENWSLSLDLYILLKTFGAVLGRRGAH